jgi:enoyl-CoA hydratase/carnithine racemase
VSDGVVRYDRRDAIATITLDRPSARNALTWEMYSALDQILDRVASEDGVRVAVLRGAGGHFAAGTDIAQFASFTSGDDGVEYERRLEAVVAKLESLPIVTIAAIEGVAMGAGLVLAGVCDLRLCTPNARFGVPIARTLGNALSIANCARLVAAIGAARTTAMLLTASAMSADDARTSGFVVDVVPSEELDKKLDDLRAHVASNAPVTLRVTKEALRRITRASVVDGDDLLRRAYGSRDFHEGVSAFLEKRSPRWEGR